ncbi:TY5A, partial [Symbiodinium necroappetens]
ASVAYPAVEASFTNTTSTTTRSLAVREAATAEFYIVGRGIAWQTSFNYLKAIGLQMSLILYQGVIMQRVIVYQGVIMQRVIVYQQVIMQRVVVYQQVIMQRVIVYQQVIMQRVVVYQQVIMQRVAVYQQVIMQRVTVYQQVIMQRVAVYQQVIMQRVAVYHQVIMQRVAVYQQVIMQRVVVYQQVITQRVVVYQQVIVQRAVVYQQVIMQRVVVYQQVIMQREGDRALRDQHRAREDEKAQGTGVPQRDEPQDDTGPTATAPTAMELIGVIATGMRQLQEAQLRQLEKKPDSPEVVKPGISSLPTLAPPGQDTSPVDIQDWLEEVGSVMTDLSDSSWDWWLQTKEVAEEHYRRWIRSTPMEKISLSIPKTPALEQGRYGGVNAGAAGMILASLPQEVKSEMITKKVTGSTPSLIFKLLTSYRPGGEKEKTLLLQQLTNPETATSAEEAVQGLRRWGRWHAQAKDLTVTVPDPVLMIKGLAAIVVGVLGKHQDVWLRTSMVRQKLQLDSNPTEESTLDYHKHLQAEMELLSTAANPAKGGATGASARADFKWGCDSFLVLHWGAYV